MNRENAYFVDCGNSMSRSELEYREEGYGELVSKTYTEYFVGQHWAAGSDQDIVLKVTTDNVLDTTWGDNGTWHYLGVNGSTTSCRDVIQLDDGRLLVAFGSFWIDGTGMFDGGKSVCCAMLAEDGTLDTSWGYNGFLVTYSVDLGILYGSISVEKLLQDSNGNFHVLGDYSLMCDEDGTILRILTNLPLSPSWVYDGVFDADGTSVIAVGSAKQISGATFYNVTAYSIEDGSLDTSFTGNIGVPGRAVIGVPSYDAATTYGIRRLSDGYVITIYTTSSSNTIGKLSLTGSVDTSWGTSGYNDIGLYVYGRRGITNIGDTVYTVAENSLADQDTVEMSRIDSSGTIDLQYFDYDTGSIDTFLLIDNFNDYLYFGTQLAETVQKWNTDFEYQDGFTSGSSYTTTIIPDETTAINTYEESESESERWLVTGQNHLIGETVAILADGEVLPRQVVDDNGNITLDQAYDIVTWGLPYKSKIMPMKNVTKTQRGSSMASKVSCKEMGISFHNTDLVRYGTADDKMFDVNFDDARWENRCEKDDLFTGTVAVSVDGGFSVDCPLQLTTDEPLPCVVRAMIPKVDVTG